MATYTFILDGKQVTVDCSGDIRLLWVLRDLLGVYGPKYGCGLDVCKACTCHINGKAFSPCSVPVSDIQPTDEITTIEGLPAVDRSCIQCSRRGSSTTSRSAATASPVRSWPRSRSSIRSGPRTGRSSTVTSTHCATSAAAARTRDYARRSSRRLPICDPGHRRSAWVGDGTLILDLKSAHVRDRDIQAPNAAVAILHVHDSRDCTLDPTSTSHDQVI
jgi:2Fe-2S iron-sulfur cluster binding domain